MTWIYLYFQIDSSEVPLYHDMMPHNAEIRSVAKVTQHFPQVVEWILTLYCFHFYYSIYYADL